MLLNELVSSYLETKKEIEKVSKNKNYNIEIEIRFGKIKKHIFNSIAPLATETDLYDSKATVEKIYEIKNKKTLTFKQVDLDFFIKEEISCDYINSSKSNKKTKLVMSLERPYKNVDNKIYIETRKKIRQSKQMNGFKIDKTIVEKDNGKKEYEIEIEITQNELDIKEFLEVFDNIQNSILKNISMKASVKSIVPELDLEKYKFNKPVDVTIRDAMRSFTKGGSISYKLDGIRKFLIIYECKKDGYGIYEISTLGEEKTIKKNSSNDQKITHVLDSEMIDNEYYIFDILVYSGKNICSNNLEKRIHYIPIVCHELNKDIQRKVFFYKPHIIFRDYNGFSKIHNLLLQDFTNNYITAYGNKCDGLIYTNAGGYLERVYKWKFVKTVDFLFTNESLKLFRKGKFVDCDFIPESFPLNIENNSIIECLVEKDKNNVNKAKFLRIRHDKTFPNMYEIAQKILRTLGNEKRIADSFKGNNVLMLRSYHNRVKEKLLNMGSGVLLDIGSGRGGDIHKWKKYRKIICIEPNLENIKELKNRLYPSTLSAEHLGTQTAEHLGTQTAEHLGTQTAEQTVAEVLLPQKFQGLNRNKKVEIINSTIENVIVRSRNSSEEYGHVQESSVDVVSAFFSLNLVDLDLTLKIIDKIAKQKSIFIATLMSKKYVKSFFDNIGTNSFSCKSYKIEIVEDKLFIHIKDTMVYNQIEKLVDVDRFANLVKKFNFRIIIRKRMDEEFFMSDSELVLSSMYEYLVMERKK